MHYLYTWNIIWNIIFVYFTRKIENHNFNFSNISKLKLVNSKCIEHNNVTFAI